MSISGIQKVNFPIGAVFAKILQIFGFWHQGINNRSVELPYLPPRRYANYVLRKLMILMKVSNK
jgi:hypothetical protein